MSHDPPRDASRAPGPAAPAVGTVVGAIALGGALVAWALGPIPGPIAPGQRTNTALAIAGVCTVVAWGVALLRAADARFAAVAAAGCVAALAGTLPSLGLATARFAWMPDGLAFRLLALYLVEVPLWGVCVALWPGRASGPTDGRRMAGWVGALVVVAGLVWLLVVRPAGALPDSLPGWTSIGAWTLVLGAVAAGVVRRPRAGSGPAFVALGASVLALFLGNLAATVPALPATVVFASGVAAAVLRVVAADGLRRRPG